MKCNPGEKKLELELNKIRIQYNKFKKGELSAVQNRTTAQREQLFKTLQQHEFELIDDPLNELIEKFKRSIVELEYYPDEDLKRSFSDHIRLNISDNFISLNKLFAEIEAASNENFSDYNKPEIKKLINTASGLAIKRLNLLENLQAWSDAQNKTFNPIKINLRKLVVTEFDRFDTSADQKHVTLDHSISLLLHVSADELMITNVFRNLISDAIEFSNTGGSIFISATEGKQFVEIEVKDNGIEISQNTLDSFFKTDENHSISGTDTKRGTGLSLFICKKFIEMHGEKIQIESKQDKGCSVKFRLPYYM